MDIVTLICFFPLIWAIAGALSEFERFPKKSKRDDEELEAFLRKRKEEHPLRHIDEAKERKRYLRERAGRLRRRMQEGNGLYVVITLERYRLALDSYTGKSEDALTKEAEEFLSLSSLVGGAEARAILYDDKE